MITKENIKSIIPDCDVIMTEEEFLKSRIVYNRKEPSSFFDILKLYSGLEDISEKLEKYLVKENDNNG